MDDRYRSSNPIFREGVFDSTEAVEYVGPTMTVRGAVGKTSLLLAIMVGSAAIGWNFPSVPIAIGSFAVALVLSLVIAFVPKTAPYLAPAYAVFKGLLLGIISVAYASAYNGIVPQAILLTTGIFLVMLSLYATKVIRVTETFRMVVAGATLGVFLTYIVCAVISIFNPGIYQLPMFQGGPIGIGFSLLVIGIAAFNLAVDFQNMTEGEESNAPKYMEWYTGFGLLVTLAWVYLEVLRLLAKLRR